MWGAVVALLAATTMAAPIGPAVPGAAEAADLFKADVIATDAAAQASLPAASAEAWHPPAIERTPLGVPAASLSESPADTGGAPAEPRLSPGTLRTAVSLAGVLLLIFALAWGFKRVARLTGGLAGQVGAGGRAPSGLVEVLARYPVGGRQTLVVLRFDRRVLLCSMAGGGRSAAGTMTTLCELDQPEDVASVLIKTRDEAGDSIARTFERAMEDEADRYAHRTESREHETVRGPHGPVAGGGGTLSRSVASFLRGGRLS